MNKPPENNGSTTRLKKTLFLLSLAIFAYVVFRIFLLYELEIIWIVYELCAFVPIICYIISVRGQISSNKISPDQLPDDMTDQQKSDYIALDLLRKKQAKKFIYFAFPFIVALMIAFVVDFYIPMVFG